MSVKGTLNGIDFSISRTKTLSRGSLTFLFGGEDLTAQSAQETQKLVNEKLGISAELLSRTLFHGQHALNGLLESTDTKLKDELSLIVPLDIWQKAASLARKRSSIAGKLEAQLEGMVSVRTDDLKEAKQRLLDLSEQLRSAKSLRDVSLSRCEESMTTTIGSTENDTATKTESLERLKGNLASCETNIAASEKELLNLKRRRDTDLATLDGEIKNLERSLAHIETTERNLCSEQQVLTGRLEIAEENIVRLETMWNVDLSHGIPQDFELPSDCPTCSQPINDFNDVHRHENLQSNVLNSLKEATGERESLHEQMYVKAEEIRKAQHQIKSLREKVDQMKEDLEKRKLQWTAVIEEKENAIAFERDTQRGLSIQLSDLASSIDRDLQRASLDATLHEANEKLRYLQKTVDSVQSEVAKLEETLFELNTQRDQQSRSNLIMSELSQLFSPKGIQSFILKNTIVDLETATQAFLTEISDGAQKLKLSLESGEGISRRAFVTGHGGTYVERPLASLSGGQWRRCSLALNFGFAELIARRGKFRCSLCILDEPLTHLDRSGRSDVGRLLRRLLRQSYSDSNASLGLSYETVLMILQDLAAEELEESFDSVDQVIKRGGVSSVAIEGGL